MAPNYPFPKHDFILMGKYIDNGIPLRPFGTLAFVIKYGMDNLLLTAISRFMANRKYNLWY